MNYSQTLEYLYSQLPMFQRVGSAAYKADLGNTLALTDLLGHPERKFRSVHVAGTNGKGSVSHMLASVYQEAGYKTGLYTSPHLKDFRERIRINGRMVPKSFITHFVIKYMKAFEQIRPSFFEYTAVMAFEYFATEKVDIAILETGMGGRLDSTNVVTPILSIITNISLDHTAFLGNTLPEIANEKAGIIKPGIPVVIGETQEETRGVFIEKAREMKSPIIFADQIYHAEKNLPVKENTRIIEWNIHYGDKSLLEGLKCPLRGNYQGRNLITAIGALKEMEKQALLYREDHLRQGVRNVTKNTGLQGRWQIAYNRPKVIFDIGHNEAGIRHILEQLTEEDFRYLHWVFGMVNDKETDKILGMLPLSAHYYFCKPNIPRGLDAKELQKEAGRYHLQGAAYSSVMEAFEAARRNASPEDLVFVGGSTFVVAEVI